jgi:hypothetical protein
MREAITSSLSNILIFACWVGVPMISPESHAFLPKAFGIRPFGFPVENVVFAVLCVLYLPFVPAICGLTRLGLLREEIDRAARQENWDRVEWLYAQRRPAARAACIGLVYFLILSGGWIAWTSYVGI